MKNKNGRAKRIMERLILVEGVADKAVALRKQAGLPENGFDTVADSRKFLSNTKIDYTELFEHANKFTYFAKNVLKDMDFDISEAGLEAPIHTYFILNTTTPKAITATDTTGCSIYELHFTDTPTARMFLPPGIYIRLGKETSNLELFEFAKANRKRSPRKPLKPLTSELYTLIEKYNLLTTTKLQQISGSQSTYRNILIAAAIVKQDEREITSETVGTYIKRSKKTN